MFIKNGDATPIKSIVEPDEDLSENEKKIADALAKTYQKQVIENKSNKEKQ